MAYTRDVVIRMLGESDSAVRAQKAAAEAAGVSVSAYQRAEREIGKAQQTMRRAAEEQAQAMHSLGRGAMIFGAVVAAGLAVSAKAAIDWESAWAGVEKTVDGTPEQMDALQASLRRLATTLPATHAEIAGVAEAAGQLGVARKDIAEFTEVAIAMGVATNLSAEEAAVGMSRLSTIMGTADADVDRMGSALVALGNAGASTEQEILDMSLRLGAAGRQAGMTEGEVLGLANAMSSVGIEAEAGGTAMSTVLKNIGAAVRAGGEDLDGYAKVAGTTAREFATAWRTDPAAAMVLVVSGLARMQAAGEDVNGTIAQLGLDGIRTSDTLLRLAGDADGMAASLATGNEAWAENDALMNEAGKRYETTASQIKIARNQMTDAAIDIGAVLLPALAAGVDLVADFAAGFQALPGPLKDTVVAIGALVAGVSLVGGAGLKLAAFRTEMLLTQAASSGFAARMAGVGAMAAGPVGIGIGVATLALGGLVTWLGNANRASATAIDFQQQLAAALEESGGALDENVRALASQKAAETEVGDSSLLDWAEELGISLPRVTDALLGNKDAMAEITDAIAEQIALEEERGTRLSQGAGQEAQAIANRVARLQELMGVFGDLGGSLGVVQAKEEQVAGATEETGDAAAGAALSMEDMAEQADLLAKALDVLNGPTLDAREAARGFQEALDAVTEAMGEEGFTATLDTTTEAGRANAAMLDDIAKAAMEQATALGHNTGSYDAFRASLDSSRQSLFDTAMQFYGNEEAAWAYVDSVLAIPSEAETDINLPTYNQVTDQLSHVHNRIAGIPPQTWTNVGVLSAAAIAQLEAVGVKTRTLPDGTVEVSAATRQAEIDLANVARDRQAIITAQVRFGSSVRMAENFGNAIGGQVGPGASRSIPAYANGGGIALVGERGPELVRFGAQGYVTPADLTRHALEAASAALTGPVAGPGGGGTTVVNHYRTYAPNISVPATRPMSARDLYDAARDDEWLHRG